MKQILTVDGEDGGVGKSTLSIMVIDYMIRNSFTVAVADTDTSKADVYFTFRNSLTANVFDLDGEDGWTGLGGFMGDCKADVIVRNCGARNGKGIKDFGDYLPLAAEASQREVTIIWVLVPQSDSIRHLRTFLKTLPDVRVIVAKNTRAPGSFYGLYDGTDLEQQILDRRGASFEIPTLSPDLVNKMKIDKPGVKNHRMTLDEIASLSSSLNIAVIRARKLFDKAVGGLING